MTDHDDRTDPDSTDADRTDPDLTDADRADEPSVAELTGANADGEIEPGGHALPPEKLVYPTFEFDEGDVDEDGGFDLSRGIDREEMIEWLEQLAGGMESHDVAVESPDGHVRFGVGAKDVAVSFDPDEDHRGELEVTFSLKARAMFVADDPSKPDVGARGGRGFIPLSMLTSDRETFRCYNWIEDPLDPDGEGR